MSVEEGCSHDGGHRRGTLGIDVGKHYAAADRRIGDIIANYRRSSELSFQLGTCKLNLSSFQEPQSILILPQ
jgi:hypothetical protein